MKLLKEKCQEIVAISSQYNKNLKKFLSEEDKDKLEKIRGENLSQKAYNIIYQNYKDCGCGKEVKFISHIKGYSKFCSISCQAKYREANWSPEMKEHRSKSISNSVKAIWDNPDNKDMLEERNKKVGLAAKNMWENATDEWKEKRVSKLSKKTTEYAKNNPEEIKERGKQHSILLQNRSDKEIKEVYFKWYNTKLKNGNIIPKELKKDYDIYIELVRNITNKNYYKFYREINPNNLKRGKYSYHLDHKLSIFEGFNRGILPIIIGSKYNLEMLTAKENLGKQKNSSLSEKDLLSFF